MRTHHTATLLASALALVPSHALASDHAPSFTAAPLDLAIPSDLPRIARPLHYDISVRPQADTLSFGGTVRITLELYEASDSLTLHSNAIAIDTAQIRSLTGETTALSPTGSDDAKQTVTLTATDTLAPGTYFLDIVYTGVIGTQAVGLFALDYPDKITGEEKRGLFTQFQAPDARRFAPMFDEPAYKATFDLTAIVPEEQMAVSNMPIMAEEPAGDGTKKVTFGTSPVMSSYLLFFAAGEFERAGMIAPDGTDIGIVAPVGSGEQTRFALEGTAEMMPWFTEYFGMPYGLPKLDNVTGPGRSAFFAAMENWGAIFSFERFLLNDPANTSPAGRQLIYRVLAHEIAHQWFGNIITMAWWDDLWLNEGFASWLETKVAHDLKPDWHTRLGRIAVRERAMALDAVRSSHPVITPINTVSETAQAFDQITYAKGEAVIAMFEAAAGEDTFRDGLRLYFDRHAFTNTVSDDLWTAMEAAGARGLRDIANDFTRQAGVPLVKATSACINGETVLDVSQEEFTLDRSDDPAFSPGSWRVPLNITVNNGPISRHILEGNAQLTLPGCGAVNLNAGQVSYFRSDYSETMLGDIAERLDNFAPIDQLGLVRDGLAMSNAGYKPFGYGAALLEAVPGDANPVVAGFAVRAWADIQDDLADELIAARGDIAEIARDAWSERLAALGLEPRDDEPLVKASLRADLIRAFGELGDKTIVEEAQRRFAALAANPRALDGPLKSTWLNIATANADQSAWELLLSLAEQSNSPVEKELYFSRLGATDDEALAQRTLDYALTGKAGTFSAQLIEAVSVRHPELAFNFAVANYNAVRALVDDSGWQGYMAELAETSDDPALIETIRAFSGDLPADELAPFERVIGSIALRVARKDARQADIVEWLRTRAG